MKNIPVRISEFIVHKYMYVCRKIFTLTTYFLSYFHMYIYTKLCIYSSGLPRKPYPPNYTQIKQKLFFNYHLYIINFIYICCFVIYILHKPKSPIKVLFSFYRIINVRFGWDNKLIYHSIMGVPKLHL